VRLGLKLGPDDAENLGLLIGRSDPLAGLRELGVEAVEIPLGLHSPLDRIAAWARRCRQAGLMVSFHPYTEGTPANPAHFEGPEGLPGRVHLRFLSLAAAVAAEQGETVVNLHPAAAGPPFGRETLFARSVDFFSWLQEWCAVRAPEVRPVAELQVSPAPGEVLHRVGDQPEELELLATRAAIDVCWDVGHAVLNHRRWGYSLDPGPGLWSRISHIHCHEVSDSDHRPPRRPESGWGRFLRAAKERGYPGTVVVEVTVTDFLAEGGARVLIESFSAVGSV
jgi:sugar phosphate isomerase/epimerase